MTYTMFARWFGIVSIILSLGILFNLEDAREMAKNMIKTETGYIMGGVLPIIFGTLALLFVISLDEEGWSLIVSFVGIVMVTAGIYRVFFVQHWKTLMAKHIDQIPFLFSLFGLMFGVILIYVGFISALLT